MNDDSDLADAGSATPGPVGSRVLPPRVRTESVEVLEAKLAEARRAEAERDARRQEWVAKRAAERAEGIALLDAEADRLAARLHAALEIECSAEPPAIRARASARAFLQGGRPPLDSHDAQLAALASVQLTTAHVLVDLNGIRPGDDTADVTQRLDALERDAWSALYARARRVAGIEAT
jgi:hypothetical protein